MNATHCAARPAPPPNIPSTQSRTEKNPLWLILTTLCLALSSTYVHAQSAHAIEYYNALLNHYFVTASAAEAAAIDGGSAGPGWSRTGGFFAVSLSAAAQSKAVCRFYSASANSHFYTADAAECSGLQDHEKKTKAQLAPSESFRGWQYEGIAFYAQTPSFAQIKGPATEHSGSGCPRPELPGFRDDLQPVDTDDCAMQITKTAQTAECPTGTMPVYRTYNNRAAHNDSNHRFTADIGERGRMLAANSTDEGIAFCADAASQMAGAGTVFCGPWFNATKVVTRNEAVTYSSGRQEFSTSVYTPSMSSEFDGTPRLKISSMSSSDFKIDSYWYTNDQVNVRLGVRNASGSESPYFYTYSTPEVRPQSYAFGATVRWVAEVRTFEQHPSLGEEVARSPIGSERTLVARETVTVGAGTFANVCVIDTVERSDDDTTIYESRFHQWISPVVGVLQVRGTSAEIDKASGNSTISSTFENQVVSIQ